MCLQSHLCFIRFDERGMLLPACSLQANHYVFINISFSCEDNGREVSPKTKHSSGLEREITKGLFLVNPISKITPCKWILLQTPQLSIQFSNLISKEIKGRNSN